MEINEKEAISDFWEIVPPKVLRRIMDEFSLKNSDVHGVNHWSRVYYYGHLLSKNHSIDLEIIAYFSIFHDSKRICEHEDPEHGYNGAEFFKKLESIIHLKPENKEIIYEACSKHNYQEQTNIKEIGVCFDADRLDLWRVDIQPYNRYLHFDESKSDLMKQYTKQFIEYNYKHTHLSKSIIKNVYDSYDLTTNNGINEKLNFVDKFLIFLNPKK